MEAWREENKEGKVCVCVVEVEEGNGGAERLMTAVFRDPVAAG